MWRKIFKNMKPNIKLILIILFVLLEAVLNLGIIFKAYQKLAASIKTAEQKVQSQIDFDELKQALVNLEQRKPLEFSKREFPVLQAQFQIEILNGSGIAGAAAKLEKNLQTIQDLSITISNTEKTSSSLVKSKKTVTQEVKEKILAIVSQDFAAVSQKTLPDDSSWDMVIILGE